MSMSESFLSHQETYLLHEQYSCIDHVIANIIKCFMKSMALESGISDHHKMITTIFRSTFAKDKPKTPSS